MNRGIVLEIQGEMATVLTPDGRFLRVRVPRGEAWCTGEAVAWPGRPARAFLRPVLAMACVLFLLLVPGGMAYQQYWALGPVVAYVSVDINPSLELGVDARERVCVARALNSDGEKLLAGLPYRRRHLEIVLSDLTSRAVAQGYLGRDGPGAVLLAVTPADGGKPGGEEPLRRTAWTRAVARWKRTAVPDPADLRDRAVAAAHRALQERGVEAVMVKGLAATPEVREEARRLGISPGRLAVYLAAREAGMEVTLGQLREGPVARVLREAWEQQLRKGKPDRPPGADEQPGGGKSLRDGTGVPSQRPADAPGKKVPAGKGRPAGGPGDSTRGAAQQPEAGAGSAAAEQPPELEAPEEKSPREMWEKLWERGGVEKELPGLMKKFLPPPGEEKSGGKGRDRER